MGETNVLFSIGPLEVTGAVVTMWVIVAVLALLSWLATRRLRDVPGPLQNAAEMAVEKLQGFYGGILGPANARRYFPMMATFFIFIVVSNYIGLLPGAGQVFTVPTATLSVTAGLAIIAFCMTHTVGIQRRGLGGYLKSFIKPFLLMLPLNLIEQILSRFFHSSHEKYPPTSIKISTKSALTTDVSSAFFRSNGKSPLIVPVWPFIA